MWRFSTGDACPLFSAQQLFICGEAAQEVHPEDLSNSLSVIPPGCNLHVPLTRGAAAPKNHRLLSTQALPSPVPLVCQSLSYHPQQGQWHPVWVPIMDGPGSVLGALLTMWRGSPTRPL